MEDSCAPKVAPSCVKVVPYVAGRSAGKLASSGLATPTRYCSAALMVVKSALQVIEMT